MYFKCCPRPSFKVAICDLKHSSLFNWNSVIASLVATCSHPYHSASPHCILSDKRLYDAITYTSKNIAQVLFLSDIFCFHLSGSKSWYLLSDVFGGSIAALLMTSDIYSRKFWVTFQCLSPPKIIIAITSINNLPYSWYSCHTPSYCHRSCRYRVCVCPYSTCFCPMPI